MKSNVLFWLLIALSINSINAAMNFSCFNPNRSVTLQLQLPEMLSSYKVAIEIVNTTDEKEVEKEFATDVFELFDGGRNVSTIRRVDPAGRYQWIFNHTSKVYSYIESDFSCNTSVWTSEVVGSPLLFPSEKFLVLPDKPPVISLKELWDHARRSEIVFRDFNNSEHDHGIPVEHYIGCSNVTQEPNVIVEYEICLTEKNFTLPDSSVKTQVPTRIELKVYKGTNVTNAVFLHHIVYEMSAYRAKIFPRKESDFFLPPNGVFCKGMNNTKDIPKFPNKFSVKIEYADGPSSTLDSNMLFFDNEKHISALEYTTNYTDEPMAAGVKLAKGRYKIIHDFNSGYEYVIDDNKDTCETVDAIPSTSGDVEETPTTTNKDNKTLAMKNAMSVLLAPENVNFVYIGVRYSNLIPCDVWTARGNDTKPNEFKTYELWVVCSNWTLDNGFGSPQKSLPLMLRVYHGDDRNRTTTVQHFHDYKVYNDTMPMPWDKLDVLPCLTFVQNVSYLVVKMSGNEESLRRVGYTAVKNQLREKIADKANVSILRISEFYFQPVPTEKSIWVFFLLANRTEKEPAKTKWSSEEIDVVQAYKNLNASLALSGFEIVIGKEKFEVQKSSLNGVPPMFHPSNSTPPTPITTHEGYTSGSMAGLGICMLLIGGVGGLGLAFFLWKRNRGIAYQIYE